MTRENSIQSSPGPARQLPLRALPLSTGSGETRDSGTMYEFLRGTLVEKGPTLAVLDVGGIGFRIEVSVQTSMRLPPPGETARLLTRLKPQEDALRLFGFFDAEERELFSRLTAIAGIGPTHALALLSAFPPLEIWGLADGGDAKTLAKTRGVGPKLAQRICVELAGRRPVPAQDPAPVAGTEPGADVEAEVASADAIDALLVLGLTEDQARKAIRRATRTLGPDAPSEELIRLALRGG